ncbi:GtrA family protein [Streptomyces albulus]|uniref:GtrA family protein n=1 Tax=Streptomyces noursei TaxID=1971 RepID=UPI001F1F8A1C|nr:GtrA family protein [Streptomyces noursei]MCE4945768.1 GtrA family protein [Streptomyces noursei]
MPGPLAALPWGQVARFTLVGGVNTATFYACYLPLHRLLPYFAAYTAGFVLSLVGSFLLNTYFTYRTRPTWKKFLLFPLTQVTNYAVQSAGLVALVSWWGMNSVAAPLAAALLALPVTFVVSRRILRPPARRGDGPDQADQPDRPDQTDQTEPPVRSGRPV